MGKWYGLGMGEVVGDEMFIGRGRMHPVNSRIFEQQRYTWSI
jgi:hypothetical protein